MATIVPDLVYWYLYTNCGGRAVYLDSIARKLRFPKHMAVISKNTLPLLSKCDHAAIWTYPGPLEHVI